MGVAQKLKIERFYATCDIITVGAQWFITNSNKHQLWNYNETIGNNNKIVNRRI